MAERKQQKQVLKSSEPAPFTMDDIARVVPEHPASAQDGTSPANAAEEEKSAQAREIATWPSML